MPVLPPEDMSAVPWVSDHADCVHSSTTAEDSITVSSSIYGGCSMGRDINTSRWLDYHFSTKIGGITRQATAIIVVRDGVGTRHKGRVELAVGQSEAVLRQQLENGSYVTLAKRPLTGQEKPTARLVEIDVVGDRVDVALDGSGRKGPQRLSGTVDTRLSAGGVSFWIAPNGLNSITFAAPTLKRTPTGPRESG
jgi:hypothetical protein